MRVKLFAVSGLLLLSPLYAAFASSFTQLVVFGDSLSDNGNASIATAGLLPGANYGSYTFSGGLTTSYFSDGANTTPVAAGQPGVWVDKLATDLGVVDPQPALALTGGTNFAVGGAQTGTATPQDMGNQIALYTASHPGGASATALYALWGGANDILDGNSPTQAADNVAKYISALAADGAKNFVWLNLPLLGDTPAGAVDKTALNAASVAFDSRWAFDLAALEGSGIKVDGVNIEALFADILGNPGKYGLTNVTQSAQGLNIPNDAGYLFWDGRHPTTAVHTLVADAVHASLVATPEPASVGFAGLGVLALAGLSLRKRSSSAAAKRS